MSAVTVVAERMIKACGAHDRLEELTLAEVELEVHLVAGGPEPVETSVGDLLRHEDAGHGASLVGSPAEPPT